jgi:hypothetical protein
MNVNAQTHKAAEYNANYTRAYHDNYSAAYYQNVYNQRGITADYNWDHGRVEYNLG